MEKSGNDGVEKKEVSSYASDDVGSNVLSTVCRFAMKSAFWFGIYVFGYFNFSFGWLVAPLLLSVFREQWKRDRDLQFSSAKEAALRSEKDMILSRIGAEDLPSWVYFPDRERAEWINLIVKQLWSNIGHYTRTLIQTSIEPSIRSVLDDNKMYGFKFEKISLGQICPRIEGIKVYDANTCHGEILMDLDIIYASDCEIAFSVKRIVSKVTDFMLRGTLRVVFKPLITDIPLVGGVQAFFINKPTIDFDLGGVGNVLDLPGLSGLIRKIIVDQIGYFIVSPNKFSMSLAAGVETKVLKFPRSAGVLRVKLIEAKNVMKKDFGLVGLGKSDPYATLNVGARTVQSPTVKNTVNPEWNFYAEFPVEFVEGQVLTLNLYDYDDTGNDEFLGRATIQASLVVEKKVVDDIWVDLEDVESGRVHLSLSWHAVSDSKRDYDETVRFARNTKERLTTALLFVFVDNCHDLVETSASMPSPFVRLEVGHDSQETWSQCLTDNPVFEQGFVFMLSGPESDVLVVKVLDSLKKNKEHGHVKIPVIDLFNEDDHEKDIQPFRLVGSNSGTVDLWLKLKFLNTPSKGEKSACKHVPGIASVDTPKPVLEAPKPVLEATGATSTSNNLEVKEESKVQRPSLDEMVASTISPMLETAEEKEAARDVDGLFAESQLRHRKQTSCGRIQLGLNYGATNEKLVVTVHRAAELPGSDRPDPPDPYVKMYLLPDRSKKSKRKTDDVKDSCNPVYEEIFEYDIALEDLNKQQLEVSVIDHKKWARNPLMGQCVVDLNVQDLSRGVKEWFDLQEAEQDSD